jgi:hypothetical protein
MLDFLGNNVTERKTRLLGSACLRNLFWGLLIDPRSRAGLDVADRYADGDALPDEVDAAYGAATAAFEAARFRYFGNGRPAHQSQRGYFGGPVSAALYVSHLLKDRPEGPRFGVNPYRNATNSWWVVTCAYSLPGDPASPSDEAGLEAMRRAEAPATELVREIFGNPGRSTKLDHAWLAWNNGTIGRLARVIYEERTLPAGTLDLSRLAVLADALEDAGCTDAGILNHLRSPGPHVRGCAALDLLLEKT